MTERTDIGVIASGTIDTRGIAMSIVAEAFNQKVVDAINEPAIKLDNRNSNVDTYRKFVRNRKGAKR